MPDSLKPSLLRTHTQNPEHRFAQIDEHAAAALRGLMLIGASLRQILHPEWCNVDFERALLRFGALQWKWTRPRGQVAVITLETAALMP